MDIPVDVGVTSDHIRRAVTMYFAGASVSDFRAAFGALAPLCWAAARVEANADPLAGIEGLTEV